MSNDRNGQDIPRATHHAAVVTATPQNTPASLPTAPIAKPTSMQQIAEEDESSSTTTRGVVANPALMSMIEGKLETLIGRSSGYIENLPAVVRKRLVGLKGIQSEYNDLNNKFQAEILELEKRYNNLATPIYAKRLAIIKGEREPLDEEIAKGREEERKFSGDDEEQGDDEDDDDQGDDAEESTPANGIPNFWLTALQNLQSVADLITPRDEECLKNLIDIRLSYLDKPGFVVEFVFDEANQEFFSNQILKKSYFYQDEVSYNGEFLYDHAEGDEIKWAEGRNLTVHIETKKQRNKHTNQTRIVKRQVPVDSFFSFFNPPKLPTESEDEIEITEELEEKLEQDYQIGEDIKEKLIPHAVDWYTGDALAYEDVEGMSDVDDEYSSEEDEDDDEDEDDEDEEEGTMDIGKRAGGSKRQDPECKQQ